VNEQSIIGGKLTFHIPSSECLKLQDKSLGLLAYFHATLTSSNREPFDRILLTTFSLAKPSSWMTVSTEKASDVVCRRRAKRLRQK